jgi:hypothetical protein
MRTLAVFAALVAAGSAGCGGEQTRGQPVARGAPDQRELARNGISMAVLPRWDGRILFRDAAGSQGVSFQVANFELPANEGFEPPQELPPGEEDPIKAMDAGDVLVTVVSDHPGGEPAPATISLDDLRRLPAGTLRVPHGHTLAVRSFCYGARCVQVEVDLGGPAEPALLNQVEKVLASLEVEQRSASTTSADDGPRGCPRDNWPGPWTACAEAEWVRRVVEKAGYRVVGATGSALVARGHGRSFYVWTTRGEQTAQEIADDEGGDYLASIASVRLYGDDDWRFWGAQGFIFWVHEGPRGDAIVPAPAELAQLVRASWTISPPAE